MQIYTALVHHVGYTHKEPFHSNLATMTMAGLASFADAVWLNFMFEPLKTFANCGVRLCKGELRN